MRLPRALFLVIGAVAIATACASVYVGEGADASAPDAQTVVPPAPIDATSSDSATTDAGTPELDAQSDAPVLLFSDDFERTDASLVPPWSSSSLQDGRLAVEIPDGGTSRGLTALTSGPDSDSFVEYRFASSPVRRARVSFSAKVVEMFLRDGGSNETVNLFSIRIDTAPTNAGPGPEHVLRVGIRRRTTTTFSLFVMSQFNPGASRVIDSSLRFDVGTKYAIRLEVDTTSPQPGKPVATGYVNDAPVVTLDGTGERVFSYADTGRLYFPGAVSGGGFHLQLDDLNVVGTR